MAEDEFHHYFGLWSAQDIRIVAELLKDRHVRFKITEDSTRDEENLRAWCAWNEDSPEPHRAFNLWVHDDDFDAVGTSIVDRFPQRR